MLYKKYVIEVTVEVEVLMGLNTSASSTGDNINFQIIPDRRYVNVIKYIDGNACLCEIPLKLFDTKKQAQNFIEKRYYDIMNSVLPHTLSIKEIYDDIEPPLEVMRGLKLNKIMK